MAWLQLGVHVVFMIGDQVDRLWGRDFYKVRGSDFSSLLNLHLIS